MNQSARSDNATGIESSILGYVLVVSLGGFIFGYDATVISGAIGFINDAFNLTEWQTGWVVSSPTFGALIGMLVAGPMADKFGRRNCLLAVAALYIISALFSALAQDFSVLVTARFVGGLAFCSLMLAPMYIAEIASPEHRGKLVSVNQFNIVIGLSASYFVNYGLLQLSQSSVSWAVEASLNTEIWRWMLAAELIPAVVWFALLWKIPMSPRWLIMQARDVEARGVMQRLNVSDVDSLYQQIKASLTEKLPPLSERLKELGKVTYRPALLVTVIVALTQQLTGINVIFFYAPTIFEQTGVGQDAAFAQAIIIGVTNVLFTLVAMWGVDKLGRRPLLLTGLVGIIVSLSVCAYGFSQGDVSQYSTLILLGIIGFVASFAMSLGPIMWVLFSEIFPNSIRAVAISLVTVINSGASFIVQFVFPWQLANIGAAGIFLSYSVVAVIGLLLLWRLMPETKGTNLDAV